MKYVTLITPFETILETGQVEVWLTNSPEEQAKARVFIDTLLKTKTELTEEIESARQRYDKLSKKKKSPVYYIKKVKGELKFFFPLDDSLTQEMINLNKDYVLLQLCSKLLQSQVDPNSLTEWQKNRLKSFSSEDLDFNLKATYYYDVLSFLFKDTDIPEEFYIPCLKAVIIGKCVYDGKTSWDMN